MKLRALVIAAVLAGVPRVAAAEEPAAPAVIPARARALVIQGRAFYDAGDYGNAIIAFKEAYVRAPASGLLFNLAQVYRLAGQCEDAASMYRRYIATDPSADGRTIAQGHLAIVERRCHQASLAIPQDPGAPVVITTDNASLFTTPPRASRGSLAKTAGLGFVIGGGVALAAAAYYGVEAHRATDGKTGHEITYAKVFGIAGGVAVAGGLGLYILGRRTERMPPILVTPAKHGAAVSASWEF